MEAAILTCTRCAMTRATADAVSCIYTSSHSASKTKIWARISLVSTSSSEPSWMLFSVQPRLDNAAHISGLIMPAYITSKLYSTCSM